MSSDMKTLDGYPGIKIYRDGRIIGKRCKPIGHIQLNGYLYCWVRNNQGVWKEVLIHRLIALAFVTNPRPDIFKFIDHIDENKLNDCASNLRWCCKTINCLNTHPSKCKGRDGLTKPYRAQVKMLGNDKQHYVYSEFFPSESEAKEAMYQKRQEIIVDLYFHLTHPFTGKASRYYQIYKSRL
jgi:hypothetical protein